MRFLYPLSTPLNALVKEQQQPERQGEKRTINKSGLIRKSLSKPASGDCWVDEEQDEFEIRIVSCHHYLGDSDVLLKNG